MKAKFKETKKIKEWGRVDYFPRHSVISVNPAKGGSFDTIVHEYLHWLFPFLTEKEVKSLTKVIVSKATLKDQKEVIEDYIKRCK
jgi:hypothetical protein